MKNILTVQKLVSSFIVLLCLMCSGFLHAQIISTGQILQIDSSNCYIIDNFRSVRWGNQSLAKSYGGTTNFGSMLNTSAADTVYAQYIGAPATLSGVSLKYTVLQARSANYNDTLGMLNLRNLYLAGNSNPDYTPYSTAHLQSYLQLPTLPSVGKMILYVNAAYTSAYSKSFVVESKQSDGSWVTVATVPYPSTDQFIELDTLTNNNIVSQTPVTYRIRSNSYNVSSGVGYGPLIGALLVQKYLPNDVRPPYRPYYPVRNISTTLSDADWVVKTFTETKWLNLVPTQAPRSIQLSPASTGFPEVLLTEWNSLNPDEVTDALGNKFPNAAYPNIKYMNNQVMTGKIVSIPYYLTLNNDTSLVQAFIDFKKAEFMDKYLPILGSAYQLTGNETYARYVALALDKWANTLPDYFLTIAWNYETPIDRDVLLANRATITAQRASDHNGLAHEFFDGTVLAYDYIFNSKALQGLAAEKGYDTRNHITQDFFLNTTRWLLNVPTMDQHLYTNLSFHIVNMLRSAAICGDTPLRDSVLQFLDTYYDGIIVQNFKRDGMFPEAFSYHEGYAKDNYADILELSDYFTRLFPPSNTLESTVASSSTKRIEFLRRGATVQDSVAFPNGDLAPFNDTYAGNSVARNNTASYLMPAYQHGMLGFGSNDQQIQVNLTATDKNNHIHNNMLGMTLFSKGNERLGNIRYSRIPGRQFTSSTVAQNLVAVDQSLTQYYSLERQYFGNDGHVFTNGFFTSFEPGIDSVALMEAYSKMTSPGKVSRYQRIQMLNSVDTASPYLLDIFVVKGGTTHDYILNGSTQIDQVTSSSLPLQRIAKQYPLLPATATYTDPVNVEDARNWYGAFRDVDAATSNGNWNVTFKDNAGTAAVKIFGLDDGTAKINVGISPNCYRREVANNLYAYWRPSLVEQRVGTSANTKSVFVHVIESYYNSSGIVSITPLALANPSDEYVALSIQFVNGRKDVVLVNLHHELVDSEYANQTITTADGIYSLVGKAGLFTQRNGLVKGYLFQGHSLNYNAKSIVIPDSIYAGTITGAVRKANGAAYDALITNTVIPEGTALKGKWMSLRYGSYNVINPPKGYSDPQKGMNELFQIERVKNVGGLTHIIFNTDHYLDVAANTTTEILRPQRTFNGATTFRIMQSVAKVMEGGKNYQTLTFDPISTKNIGDTDFTPVATASSGLTVSFSSSNNSVATIVSGKIHIVGVGNVTITATQAGDANYYAANTVQQSFVVTPFITPSLEVATAADLQNALTYAQPGDTIIIKDGVYNGKFVIPTNASGDVCNPITLRGSKNVILNGGNVNSGYVLYVQASYWRLQNFTVTNGLKGIMCDGANYNVFDSLSIHDFGTEAIHFRTFSSHNLLKNSAIYNTGLVTPDYGEGVYIGSAVSNWGTYTNFLPDKCDSNVVSFNTIGPNVSAECVDIKEGTTGGIIYGNTFNARGITGANDADSWIDVKGNYYLIEKNIGFSPVGNTNFLDGYQTHIASTGWGNFNVFKNNTSVVNNNGYGFNLQLSNSKGTATSNKVYNTNKTIGAVKGVANVTLSN